MNVSGLTGSGETNGNYNAISGASSIANSADAELSAMRSSVQQQTQSFKDMSVAFQGGDLAGAQSAFGNLQQTIQSTSQAHNGRSVFDPNGAIANDFQSIGAALQSGDLTGAKSAFAAFKQDIRAARFKGPSSAAPTPNDSTPSSLSENQFDALA